MHMGSERVLRDLNRIEAAANDVCLQIRNLQGLCRVLGFLAEAGNTDGLDPHELGHVALLMEDVLKDAMGGIEHIEGVAVGMRGSLRHTQKKHRSTTLEAVRPEDPSQGESESSQPDDGQES
jgi:hypothetical protein